MKRALVLAALLAPGCAGLQPPPAQPLQLFVLDAQPRAAREAGERGPAPAVSVRARPGFDTARMAYVRRPHEVEYFAHSRWADTPARMLAPLIAQACRRQGAVKLDAELVRLAQDFTARPSRVRLTLRATLIETASSRVLAARELDELEDAPSDDPYGGVLAANRALERLLGRLAEFCAG
jgi:cholesterol transport system auxiliary component